MGRAVIACSRKGGLVYLAGAVDKLRELRKSLAQYDSAIVRYMHLPQGFRKQGIAFSPSRRTTV